MIRVLGHCNLPNIPGQPVGGTCQEHPEQRVASVSDLQRTVYPHNHTKQI